MEKVLYVLFHMTLCSANSGGYMNNPNNVVHKFCKQSSKSGVEVFRVFNSLNYTEKEKLLLMKLAASVGSWRVFSLTQWTYSTPTRASTISFSVIIGCVQSQDFVSAVYQPIFPIQEAWVDREVFIDQENLCEVQHCIDGNSNVHAILQGRGRPVPIHVISGSVLVGSIQ